MSWKCYHKINPLCILLGGPSSAYRNVAYWLTSFYVLCRSLRFGDCTKSLDLAIVEAEVTSKIGQSNLFVVNFMEFCKCPDCVVPPRSISVPIAYNDGVSTFRISLLLKPLASQAL